MNTRQSDAQNLLVCADGALGHRDFSSALNLYNQVFSMGFESWPMHVNAAQCHKRLGDLDGAFRHFDRAFMIKRRPDSWAGELPPNVAPAPNEPTSAIFVSNLRDQLDHLKGLGQAPWYTDAVSGELAAAGNFLESAYGRSGAGMLDFISPWVTAMLKLAPNRPALSVDGDLLSTDMKIQEIPLYGGDGDRFYVIDNLFSPQALAGLLEQLLASTIWFDARPQRSYLGAHLHDGLATPLMLEVAKNLRGVVEKLVGNVVVAQLWAFRYLANSKGIDIHADQGDWNLNVWPVSEENLVDTGDQGGMTIYDLRIADDIPFDQYNSRPELNKARIERANAHAHVVPYRGNRAVVFPSKYLHKTNAATFANTFAGRRINLTLMADKAV
ncbi:hypothetical protein [Rhizobium sp. Root1204]|uniref:hypothetical protein n=1 Tax=Rhizobium sp. Root1204 TaxID=1736428 RepID=UPI000712CE1F|nr:hypothetical protein [Rhizobium sp. Root1204]KQV36975.1 hypothetical protein ASC96_26485 [Rhizobium sp. Root1204]